MGAIHDTILAVHLIVASDRALLVMPAAHPALTADVGEWLAALADGPLTADQAAGLRAAVARCPVAKTLAGGVAVRDAGATT